MAFVGSITVGGAILGAGALGGAAALGSAAIGANAAGKASGVQANAAANALALQRDMFNQSQQNYDTTRSQIQNNFEGARANFDPYLNVGKGATYTLGSLYGIGSDGSTGGQQDFSQFTNSPDYAFAQQQGNLALDRANNAKGLNLSGGALKDAMQFNQGLASQQFGNYYNRLLSLASLGQNATSGVAGLTGGQNSALASLTSGQSNNAANFSGQMSNSIQGQGQAVASGIVGQANAYSGGLTGTSNAVNGAVGNSLLYNAINRSSYAQPGSGNSMGTY